MSFQHFNKLGALCLCYRFTEEVDFALKKRQRKIRWVKAGRTRKEWLSKRWSRNRRSPTRPTGNASWCDCPPAKKWPHTFLVSPMINHFLIVLNWDLSEFTKLFLSMFFRWGTQLAGTQHRPLQAWSTQGCTRC